MGISGWLALTTGILDLLILNFLGLTTGIAYLLENMCSNAEGTTKSLGPNVKSVHVILCTINSSKNAQNKSSVCENDAAMYCC